MSDLPFELYEEHKAKTRYNWKKRGLNMNNFEEIYNNYIHSKYCELCNKQFTKTIDRQMEHCHETGEFRNIVCNSCNALKADKKIQTNNTSGYKGISKKNDIRCKQGFTWRFRVNIDGKHKYIKQSQNFDELVEFAKKWKKENNYYK